MIAKIGQSEIRLFRSLFRGRHDVFALRWEKEGKGGYMPAYEVDWEKFRKHKAKGGTFKNLEDKIPKLLTDDIVKGHLIGELTVGIYPLLADNTSYFIAADFDGKNWLQDCRKFMGVCTEFHIPTYLERSRSGNGGHVWIFFNEACAASMSRKVMFALLRIAGILSELDKEESFDRLFPNQDFHSGKGFGNLIALPLNGKSVLKENSCFIDLENDLPFQDQWGFLRSIQKIGKAQMESLFKMLVDPESNSFTRNTKQAGKLIITLHHSLSLNRIDIPASLISFLKDSLNIPNSTFAINKKMGRTVHKTERFFKLMEEEDGKVILPRGFLSSLSEFCNEKKIDFVIEDQRVNLKPVELRSKAQLTPVQKEIVDKVLVYDQGVIVAPPGSGKTVMALEIIAQRLQPTLIIVHRKQLLDQWLDRIQQFLGIPKRNIGRIEGSHRKVGKEITVAMIQSIGKGESKSLSANSFGTIIVDECHHIPAKSFRETIRRFNPRFLYGLTATPIRKNRDEKLIFSFIGDIIAEIPLFGEQAVSDGKVSVNIRETNLSIPFDYKSDQYELLSNTLIFDSARNRQIVDDILVEINQVKKILLLTERRAHIEVLKLFLKGKAETIAISGEDSEKKRKGILAQIHSGNFQVLLSTGQFAGEGLDIKGLDCLFLVYPFSFEGKLLQYIGRITRGSGSSVVYDYRDGKIEMLEKMFKKRMRYYKKLGVRIDNQVLNLFDLDEDNG